MPNWGQVLEEIRAKEHEARSAVDLVRRKYLAELHKYTGRNVIAYYSGWLQKPDIEGSQINDDDKNGFMMAVHGLDCKKGLDLILHTPGGGIAATESIIDYIHRKFSNSKNEIDLRVIVPQIAMSAGTMIACSGKAVLMGKQSNLGPIDPQLKGIPAHGVIEEFKRAHEEIKVDSSKLATWQFILQKYHPTFLSECENAIALSEEFVLKNLENIMFSGDKQADKKAKKIVDYLTAYKDRKTHGRHINIDECKKIGLKIVSLEADQNLQDLVLTIHHCYMHTLANTGAFKIIENHQGAAMARILALVQMQAA
ncbi:MAG TPA: S49 family peptidase [Alphaproteobacteria bacterium]|nr:S49 family peptidase [Alphaproteobacteria bacterium]